MGTTEAHSLRSEADILARQSRPQRGSTWVPKKRDWRYATGVIQHDDYEDSPKSRSVWDTMDYDFQYGTRYNTPGSVRSRSGSAMYSSEAADAVNTPKSMSSRGVIETVADGSSPFKAICKPMIIPKGLWRQHTRLVVEIEADSDGTEAVYKVTGLVVRLRFTGRNKKQLQAFLDRPSRTTPTPVLNVYQDLAAPIPSPITPASARTAKSVFTPHKLDSIESVYEFPLFKRVWKDETYNFNMNTVRARLRSENVEVNELGPNYEWYTSAVRIDAMLPPGVPISAKEISAFYPHHVRWKGIMIRLTNNDYRGPDIMAMQAHFRGAPDLPTTTPYDMNNYQRDVVKNTIPEFRTTSYKGKSDFNLRTDQLTAGPYIHSMRKGFTLPTFEDLVRGLHRLPAGLDARGLTQCLSWYITMRNTFTPKLEMNVLHAQSLIRALREPLKPFGPQNLDRNALEQWRTTGTVESVEIEEDPHHDTHLPLRAISSTQRTQLHLNLDEEEVSMNFTLPLRHILTCPFLALHSVVAEAFKMGIDKAERRQEEAVKRGLEAKWAVKAATDINVARREEDSSPIASPVAIATEPYGVPERSLPVQTELMAHEKLDIPTGPRLIETGQLTAHKKPNIPTRPRSVNTEQLAAHKSPNIPKGPRIATVPHIAPALPVPRGSAAEMFPPCPTPPSCPQDPANSSWTSTAPAPTTPQYHTQSDEHGRPVFHGGYLDPRFGLQSGGYVQSERYLQTGGAAGSAVHDSLDYMLDEYGDMIDLYGNVIRPW